MLSSVRGCVFLGAALCSVSVALAKKTNPLDRENPVPANEQIPVIDFFRPNLFSALKLNAAGTSFAAKITAAADRSELLIYSFLTGKAQRLQGIDEQDIDGFEWLGDERLIFSVSAEKRYSVGLYVAKVADIDNAYAVDVRNASLVVAVPEATPLAPIVWLRSCALKNGADGGVVQIDAAAKPRNPVAAGGMANAKAVGQPTISKVTRTFPPLPSGIPVRYAADLAGNLAFAFTTENGVESVFRLVDDNWVKCPIDFDEVDVVAKGDGAGELLVQGPAQPGTPRALRRLEVATGHLGETLWQDEKYDPAECEVYRHPVDRRVLGLCLERARLEMIWFDPSYQRLQEQLEKAFPDREVLILGSDKAEHRFFILTYSDRHPPTYYLADLEKQVVDLIKCMAPWIDPERMRPTKVISYKSRDGYPIEGYLTLPVGASKESPAPLVVLPHGGPWVRDVWGFDGEVQFLASRGYAVFQPNYRGSPGYQWRFPTEASWDFRAMHEDVTDGVRKLLKSGLIDPDRVAIMGGSFGGYLALSGAVYEGSLYRCSVALSGVFDWAQVMKEAKERTHNRGEFGYLRRHLGDPKTQQAKFDAISPLRHVDQAKIPVFVAHGSGDQIADIRESKRLVAELKKHGVPYVSRFVPDEGHGMQQMTNRVELYEEIEKFLAANMAPRKAQPAAATPAP